MEGETETPGCAERVKVPPATESRASGLFALRKLENKFLSEPVFSTACSIDQEEEIRKVVTLELLALLASAS